MELETIPFSQRTRSAADDADPGPRSSMGANAVVESRASRARADRGVELASASDVVMRDI